MSVSSLIVRLFVRLMLSLVGLLLLVGPLLPLLSHLPPLPQLALLLPLPRPQLPCRLPLLLLLLLLLSAVAHPLLLVGPAQRQPHSLARQLCPP
jgi:hypothetical protein